MAVDLGSDPHLTIRLAIEATSLAVASSGLAGVGKALAWALGVAVLAAVLVRAADLLLGAER